MATYNWQQKDWPTFVYVLQKVEDDLFAVTDRAGHMSGLLKAPPAHLQTETLINIMVSEAIKISEIEGEYLSRKDVFSSVKKI